MNYDNLVATGCHVWQGRRILSDIRRSSPNPEFFFQIIVRIESGPERRRVFRSDFFWQERASVMEYVTPWVSLSRRLSNLRVPFHCHTMVIRRVITFARQIARNPNNLSLKDIPIIALLTLLEAQDLLEEESEEEEEEEEEETQVEGEAQVVEEVREEARAVEETQESREEREWTRYLRAERASKSAVEALKKCELVELVGEEEGECVICLSKIEVGSQAKRLPCKHAYHEDCILTWMKRSNLCPLCRFQMPLDYID